MEINGSLMLVEALAKEGVEVVFGYPGGAVLNIYDEIHKQKHFRHILTKHEQGALHAADGYARTSGKVGVAIVTSGPGFTNAVTGIATAFTDSIPLVIISGQVPTGLIGTDAFQEIDTVGISRPCTKHNYLVKDINELSRILKEAFYVARSGRPGPVLIDIPKDISAQVAVFDYSKDVDIPTYKPNLKPNLKQIKKIASSIKEAKRPLLYLGGGIILSGATDLVRKIVAQTQIPIVETLMARGVIRHDERMLLGMVGMHGSYCSNMAMSETDLIISFGARFDDRVTGKLSEFASSAKIIHIDIDPSSIGKIVNAHYPVVADLKEALKELAPLLENYNKKHIDDWRKRVEGYRKAHPLCYKDSTQTLKPAWVIQKTAEIAGDDCVVCTDVGQHQMWVAQMFPFTYPRQLVTSGGLGTMGFGFPAAMGAKVAAGKKKTVINFSGDGSIQMNSQEMMTAVIEDIPVINIILNNNYLGMVRQWQTFFYDDKLSQTVLDRQPDFVKLAEAYGAIGYMVQTKEEFETALKDAIKKKKPCFIDVAIDRRENVLPMVPSGGTLYNMILERN